MAPGAFLTFRNENAIEVQKWTSPAFPSLNIAGSVSLTADTAFRVIGVYFGVGALQTPPAVTTIEQGGVLSVHSTTPSGWASGIWSPDWSPRIINNGVVDVAAKQQAMGIDISSMSNPNFENTGTIRVVAGDQAIGVSIANGSPVFNSGVIEATSGGFRGPVGISVGSFADDFVFVNTGAIRAQSTQTGVDSIGVAYGGTGTFTNSGTILGEYALRIYTINQSSDRDYLFLNSGTMTGSVDLGLYSDRGGREIFRNSGRVVGAVDFGPRNDIYDGTGGTVTGAVHGRLGDDLLTGGAAGETLFGDEGDDTLDGGGGADQLDGGAGSDLLSFLSSPSALNFDFTLSNPYSNPHPQNFERLLGSRNADTLMGGSFGDHISGSDGADHIGGRTGADTLDGGAGDNYLRGDEGADSLAGGRDFDDLNGNMGNDTVHGNEGDDWVVGGRDDDMLYGDAGGDIVYGNLGNDTQFGGDGFDWVRGGQGNDSLDAGAGDDWIWGDRGDDTVAGGAGADVFHIFTGGGLDRVTDFSYAQGDRVVVDYGAYSVSQVGADTVVDLGSGDRMVLVGVTASSLPAGWISAL